MPKYNKSTVEIITEIVLFFEKLDKRQFTRQDIIRVFKAVYPDANENTINPMIQGMTDNRTGGAPGAVGRNILHCIGNGIYELNKERK